MSKQNEMPPVPPANRSPKGTGADPNPKPDGEITQDPKDAGKLGRHANIKQNTPNQGRNRISDQG